MYGTLYMFPYQNANDYLRSGLRRIAHVVSDIQRSIFSHRHYRVSVSEALVSKYFCTAVTPPPQEHGVLRVYCMVHRCILSAALRVCDQRESCYDVCRVQYGATGAVRILHADKFNSAYPGILPRYRLVLEH